MSSDQSHRLAGAVEKFNRSKELFDQLAVEIEAYFAADPQPYSSLGHFDSEAWEWIERLQVIVPPPRRFGIILGDCLHNLRCVLDHIIWQVTLLAGNTPDHNTQYPIASKSEQQFENMAKRRIPGLSERHKTMVEQPTG